MNSDFLFYQVSKKQTVSFPPSIWQMHLRGNIFCIHYCLMNLSVMGNKLSQAILSKDYPLKLLRSLMVYHRNPPQILYKSPCHLKQHYTLNRVSSLELHYKHPRMSHAIIWGCLPKQLQVLKLHDDSVSFFHIVNFFLVTEQVTKQSHIHTTEVRRCCSILG